MLETCVNQAAGLQAMAPQVAPRLVGVTSHGQQHGELPLLWGLCSAWVELGLSVLVLDGHTHESSQNPGLAQWLDDPLSRFNEAEDAVSWSVLPAATGLDRLTQQVFASARLGELFQNYAVVLIYANADTMTKLLKGSGLAPLLIVSPLKASSLSAYRALKQLLLDARLCPTVANIALSPVANATMPNTSTAHHLQHCAMTFLGYAIRPITIVASARADSSRNGINRLALELLENAVLLERHPVARMH
jgi:hypothetical protein